MQESIYNYDVTCEPIFILKLGAIFNHYISMMSS